MVLSFDNILVKLVAMLAAMLNRVGVYQCTLSPGVTIECHEKCLAPL